MGIAALIDYPLETVNTTKRAGVTLRYDTNLRLLLGWTTCLHNLILIKETLNRVAC